MSTSTRDSIDDLKCLEQALYTASAYMASQVKHEDAIIFIGSTRSGKSSLINYIIGNKLIGEKISKYKPVVLKKRDNNSPGPIIGLGATSETIIPSRWESRKLLYVGVWDAPGFDDNRGVVQDVTNAFYIRELFKNIKSAKIILVTDINDIANDSIRPFLSLLNSVENIFSAERMRDCFSGIGIIFSKVPDTLYDNSVDKNFINVLLKEQVLSSSAIEISESAKELIRYWTENNQNIGIFRRATKGDVSDADIDDGIFEAIQETIGLQEEILKQVSPSITHASKVFLFNIREKFSCMEAFIKLQKLVGSIFEEKITEFEKMKDGEFSQGDLIEFTQKVSIAGDRISNVLNSTMSFDKKIATIEIIDSRIGKLINDFNLKQKAKFMVFIDQLLNLKESKQFDLNLQSILTTAKTKVDESNIWIKLQLGEINQREAAEQAAKARKEYEIEIQELKKEMKEVKEHNQEVKNDLGFFATAGSFIDFGVEYVADFIKSIWTSEKETRLVPS